MNTLSSDVFVSGNLKGPLKCGASERLKNNSVRVRNLMARKQSNASEKEKTISRGAGKVWRLKFYVAERSAAPPSNSGGGKGSFQGRKGRPEPEGEGKG